MQDKITSILEIVAGVIAWFRWVTPKVKELYKILTPIIEEVEQMAKDGKIDKADRKRIVTDCVNTYLTQKGIKLNFWQRWIMPWVIDKIASSLPDFEISKNAATLVNSVIA